MNLGQFKDHPGSLWLRGITLLCYTAGYTYGGNSNALSRVKLQAPLETKADISCFTKGPQHIFKICFLKT